MSTTSINRDIREQTDNEHLEIEAAELQVTRREADVKAGKVWGLLRIAMGWTFFWAFLDKAFALGFATGRNPDTGAIDFFGKAAWYSRWFPDRLAP